MVRVLALKQRISDPQPKILQASFARESAMGGMPVAGQFLRQKICKM